MMFWRVPNAHISNKPLWKDNKKQQLYFNVSTIRMEKEPRLKKLYKTAEVGSLGSALNSTLKRWAENRLKSKPQTIKNYFLS